MTTASVVDGLLQPVTATDVDLVAERQQEIFDSAVFVTQLQLALKALGYYDGDITGVYDEATTAAVAALQRDLGLPDTGEFDEATDAALRDRLGGRLDAFTASVTELQQALAERGYYTGPIDGRYSAELIAAIKAFQRDLGVPETGVIDVATLQAIYARGVATGTPSPPPAPSTPTPTTATPPPPPPPPTVPPTAPVRQRRPHLRPRPRRPRLNHRHPRRLSLHRTSRTCTTCSRPTRSSRRSSRWRGRRATARISPRQGPVTLFAPTNEAFATVDDETLEELRTDPAAADALLRDLAVEGAVPSSELTTGELRTIGGASIEVMVDGDTITVGGASVVEPDITASNGIAHAIEALP